MLRPGEKAEVPLCKPSDPAATDAECQLIHSVSCGYYSDFTQSKHGKRSIYFLNGLIDEGESTPPAADKSVAGPPGPFVAAAVLGPSGCQRETAMIAIDESSRVCWRL